MNDIQQFSVYWFDLNPSQGSEFNKTRPCIVVSPNEMNMHLNTVIVIPLTSTILPWPFRTTIKIRKQESSAACDQIRTVDKRRCREHMSDLKPSEKSALVDLLRTMFLA